MTAGPSRFWSCCRGKELNLKQLVRATGVKRLCMASQKEVKRLTGLPAEGRSPGALLKRNVPIYLDQQGLEEDELCISACVRGMKLLLSVADLFRITGALPLVFAE